MNGRPDPATDLVRDVVDGYLAEDDALSVRASGPRGWV